jgi:serine/threonine-protein kinase
VDVLSNTSLPMPGTRTPPLGPLPVDLLGRRLDDRYEVVRLLGAGGMGLVYAARLTGADHHVAVKVIHAHRRHDPGMAGRLLGEARIGVMVRHPNIVRIHELGRTPQGLLYLVMELLEGATLRRSITAGPLPPAQAIAIAIQICAGLEEAHRRAVVHHDLKPENVMLCRTAAASDLVKILDFGIARVLRVGAGRSARADELPRVVGSLPYMSPEQIMSRAVDTRGDIYSFGVILHEMLVGELPSPRADRTDALEQRVTRMPRPAAEALGQLVRRCLQMRPEDRPRSAEVVRDTLARVLATLGDRAPTAHLADPGAHRRLDKRAGL